MKVIGWTDFRWSNPLIDRPETYRVRRLDNGQFQYRNRDNGEPWMSVVVALADDSLYSGFRQALSDICDKLKIPSEGVPPMSVEQLKQAAAQPLNSKMLQLATTPDWSPLMEVVDSKLVSLNNQLQDKQLSLSCLLATIPVYESYGKRHPATFGVGESKSDLEDSIRSLQLEIAKWQGQRQLITRAAIILGKSPVTYLANQTTRAQMRKVLGLPEPTEDSLRIDELGHDVVIDRTELEKHLDDVSAAAFVRDERQQLEARRDVWTERVIGPLAEKFLQEAGVQPSCVAPGQVKVEYLCGTEAAQQMADSGDFSSLFVPTEQRPIDMAPSPGWLPPVVREEIAEASGKAMAEKVEQDLLNKMGLQEIATTLTQKQRQIIHDRVSEISKRLLKRKEMQDGKEDKAGD